MTKKATAAVHRGSQMSMHSGQILEIVVELVQIVIERRVIWFLVIVRKPRLHPALVRNVIPTHSFWRIGAIEDTIVDRILPSFNDEILQSISKGVDCNVSVCALESKLACRCQARMKGAAEVDLT